jgi:uncharacterized protein (DUF305 family)
MPRKAVSEGRFAVTRPAILEAFMVRLLSFPAGVVAPVLMLLVTSACAGSDRDASGDTAGATASGVAAGSDTGMAGMAHGPAKDADHEFLRAMSDHHEGLVLMASAAMNKASRSETQAEAHKLHQKQAQERDNMLGMIRSSYNESHTPTAMPKHRAMNDSLQQKSGAAYDRDFYRHVVMHHREGVQMIDQFLPRLTKPQVRQMAEQMRRDQMREIAEFESKARA